MLKRSSISAPLFGLPRGKLRLAATLTRDRGTMQKDVRVTVRGSRTPRQQHDLPALLDARAAHRRCIKPNAMSGFVSMVSSRYN